MKQVRDDHARFEEFDSGNPFLTAATTVLVGIFFTTRHVHSKLIDLTAIAELLAKELNDRGIDEGPSVLGVADHLAEQLAELRDRADRRPSTRRRPLVG